MVLYRWRPCQQADDIQAVYAGSHTQLVQHVQCVRAAHTVVRPRQSLQCEWGPCPGGDAERFPPCGQMAGHAAQAKLALDCGEPAQAVHAWTCLGRGCGHMLQHGLTLSEWATCEWFS